VPKHYRDHELFMQVTCLEMEKARRGVERAAALVRIQDIDSRLAAIDREREAILLKLAASGALDPSSVPESSPSSSPSAAGGFRIQY
jgi:phage portal protein BeeE